MVYLTLIDPCKCNVWFIRRTKVSITALSMLILILDAKVSISIDNANFSVPINRALPAEVANELKFQLHMDYLVLF